jgi:hypothetical protein
MLGIYNLLKYYMIILTCGGSLVWIDGEEHICIFVTFLVNLSYYFNSLSMVKTLWMSWHTVFGVELVFIQRAAKSLPLPLVWGWHRTSSRLASFT